MFEFLQTVIAFIITLGLLIFVHEYGHFWVARRCGVKVHKFSIGFGKSLLSWRDKHDTEFVVAAIPLGGFVKMMGEPGSEVPQNQQQESFAHKTVYQRFAIVSAGPLVNLGFAVLLYWFLFMSGVSALAPFVGNEDPDGPAHVAGFKSMDEIVKVDGANTESWEDVTLALVSRVGETGKVHFTVKPEGSNATVERVIPLQQWMQGKVKEHPLKLLGIDPYMPTVAPVLGELVDGKAAQRQGLQQGDKIVSVNGVEILSWDEWVGLVRANPGARPPDRALENAVDDRPQFGFVDLGLRRAGFMDEAERHAPRAVEHQERRNSGDIAELLGNAVIAAHDRKRGVRGLQEPGHPTGIRFAAPIFE